MAEDQSLNCRTDLGVGSSDRFELHDYIVSRLVTFDDVFFSWQISESPYAGLLHSRSSMANGTLNCEAPWYGVGSLPASAVPVVISDDRLQRDFIAEEVSVYAHDIAAQRRYCGEDMMVPGRRRYAY
jgi:hypothetical protein